MSKLIDTLLRENYITTEQLDDAMDKKIGAKKPIHELLVDMGFVREEDMIRIASQVFNMPVFDLDTENIDSTLTEIIPYDKAKCYGVFPVRKEGSRIVIAMSDPNDIIALDDLRIISECNVEPVLSSKSSINRCIEKYYQSDDSLYDLLKNIVVTDQVKIIKKETNDEKFPVERRIDLKDSPVVRLVNLILTDASKSRASDIHIEPQGDFTEVRYRIDGDLRKVMKIPAKIQGALIARIKVIADLNIAEKKKTQDGRTNVQIGERKVDLRVSVMPTYYGEKIVIRLLDIKAAQVDLGKIGLTTKEVELFTREIIKPQGMVLVTGPTGSGKTSTLYSVLNYINDESKNIVTIEDPIEYLLAGVNQLQVNPGKEVTFANSLRSILRQDPNVIFVGEIRDRETADIAFRAAQTGHMVFSTLHTNSAVATITRLMDIGLEPYLINSSLNMVVAQRLVKKICIFCKTEYIPEEAQLKKIGGVIDRFGIKAFYKGKGCENCGFTGFQGRTAIFEILKIDEDVKKIILEKGNESKILSIARKKGMKLLSESGLMKVAEGITTVDEVIDIADIPDIVKTEEENVQIEIPVEQKKGLKILVVDDENDIRFVLKKRLEMAGYDVITAVNGIEAIGFAVKEKPDLIIMDVMMPEMDGFEATKRLRSRLETAVIPILMLTAKKDKESELEGLDAGADDYITKPFDKDKLLARVKILLRRKV